MQMMFWYPHYMGGWGWFAMSLGMILFWAVIIWAVVMLVRTFGRSSTQPPRDQSAPRVGRQPEQLLAERFARGEIDEDEYRRRLAVLRDAGHAPGAGSAP